MPGVRSGADQPTLTYKGFVDGDPSSSVRVSIDDSKIEGYFVVNGERLFVEPARKYTNLANDGDEVVYRQADSLVENAFLCDADIPTQLESGEKLVQGQAAQLITTLQNIELATDADTQYVSTLGGAAAANNEILGILNMTEGVYQSDLNLSLTVVYQHTWTTPDPYDGT